MNLTAGQEERWFDNVAAFGYLICCCLVGLLVCFAEWAYNPSYVVVSVYVAANLKGKCEKIHCRELGARIGYLCDCVKCIEVV